MRYFLLLALLLNSCGMYEPEKEDPPDVNVTIVDPNNPPDERQPGQATSYARIQEIMNNRCMGCHRGHDFTLSEAQLRDSNAFKMVDDGEMPPNAPLQGRERSDFLNFFSRPASLIVDF